MRYKLLVLVLHLAIFYALAFGYEHYIATLYGYEGYFFRPDETNRQVALLSVVALSLMTPTVFEKPSTLFFQYTLIFVLLPMLVLFYAEGKDGDYLAQVVIAYVISLALASVLRLKTPNWSFISEEKLSLVLLAIALAYIALMFMMGGGAYLNFDFSKVYDLRDEAASNLPAPVFNYLSPMIGKVIIPVGLVLSAIHRKYLLMALYLVCAVFMFGLTSHKAPLLNPLLVLFVYLASSSRTLIAKLSAGILVALVLAMLDFNLWIEANQGEGVFGWLGSLVLARAFILPAEINYMYYDFFSSNDWVLFSDSKITLGLIDYQYPLDVAHMIGRVYFNSDHAGANTGWLGSGYAQAGFAGLLVYAAASAVIFKYIDACARHAQDLRLITASIVIPVTSFIVSSDLPTTLLTHGLMFNLLLITCFRGRRTGMAYRPLRGPNHGPIHGPIHGPVRGPAAAPALRPAYIEAG